MRLLARGDDVELIEALRTDAGTFAPGTPAVVTYVQGEEVSLEIAADAAVFVEASAEQVRHAIVRCPVHPASRNRDPNCTACTEARAAYARTYRIETGLHDVRVPADLLADLAAAAGREMGARLRAVMGTAVVAGLDRNLQRRQHPTSHKR